MLKEPASSAQFHPLPQVEADEKPANSDPQQPSTGADNMRELIEDYMVITHELHLELTDLSSEDQAVLMRNESDLVVSFSGYFKQESEHVYTALDNKLKPYDRFAFFREDQSNTSATHTIHIIQGRLKAAEQGQVWVNALLFLLTILSVFFTGATIAVAEIAYVNPEQAAAIGGSLLDIVREGWRGYPYALSIMLILGVHEMGHFLMMRMRGVPASLPYFIPAWLISPFGTLGAAIVLRDVLKNRKILLDVGAAGPIAGFIVAVPLVVFGLSTSMIIPISDGGMVEGNSLIYGFAKLVALGDMYPNGEFDVLINQVAFAGWTGLFVTALNLIPLGQLDGGHVMFALFGERARWAFFPVILSLGLISVLAQDPTWVLFIVLLFLIGRYYAVPLDAVTPLDQTRRVVGWIALAIFVLTFTPVPFYTYTTSVSAASGVGLSLTLSTTLVIALVTIPRWLRHYRLQNH